MDSLLDDFNFSLVLFGLEGFLVFNELLVGGSDFLSFNGELFLGAFSLVLEQGDESVFSNVSLLQVLHNGGMTFNGGFELGDLLLFLHDEGLADDLFFLSMDSLDGFFEFNNLLVALHEQLLVLLDVGDDLLALSVDVSRSLLDSHDGSGADRSDLVVLELREPLDLVLHAVDFSILVLELLALLALEFVNLLSIEQFLSLAHSVSFDDHILLAVEGRRVGRELLAVDLSVDLDVLQASERRISNLVSVTLQSVSLEHKFSAGL